jgi:hypothetical protein
MDDEKIIDEVVKECNKCHPIQRETKGTYYDFDNTLTQSPNYTDPIKQREQ